MKVFTPLKGRNRSLFFHFSTSRFEPCLAGWEFIRKSVTLRGVLGLQPCGLPFSQLNPVVVRGLLLFFLVGFSLLASAQNSMGVGTNAPNPNAVLHLVSPTGAQGFLVPTYTTTERTATSFTQNLTSTDNGLLIYDADENTFYFWLDTDWEPVSTASGDMLQAIYDANANGTVDDSELVNGLTVETAVPIGAVFTDSQTATDVAVASSGDLISTDVQSALEELQSEILTLGTGDMLQSVYDIDADLYVDTANVAMGLAGYTIESSVPAAADFSDDQTALDVPVTATGALTSTDVQSALEELQSEIISTPGGDMLKGEYDLNADLYVDTANVAMSLAGYTVESSVPALADFSDDQNASEVTITPSGNLTSTDVQAALLELQADIDAGSSGGDMLQSVYDTNASGVVDAADSISVNFVDGITIAYGAGALEVRNNGISDAKISDVAWSKLTGVPTGFSDGIDDVGLTTVNTADIVDGAVTDAKIAGIDWGKISNIPTDISDGDNQTATEVPVTPTGNIAATEVQSALVELQGDIDAANTSISSNATAISTNQSSISNNTTNISTNTSDIATINTSVSSNSTAISTNQSDIANNATNIANNTSNITANTSSISSNSTAISTNQSDISNNASNIGTNTTNIATNTTSISSNSTAISTNQSDIANNATNIANNTSNITTNTSSISSNSTAISTNQSDISNNATNISTNITNIASNTSSIGSNATAISTNQSDISNNAANIATNASDITTLNTSVSSNSTAISTNQSDIANNALNISTNTSDITSINATLSGALQASNNLSELTGSAATARVNLGLGTLATQSSIATADLLNGSVTSAKILDGTIAGADLDKANIPLSGFGNAAANVNMGGFQITNMLNPSNATDAATKSYVDTQVGGVVSSQWTTFSTDLYYTGGEVGIGTNTPNNPLHVVANDASGIDAVQVAYTSSGSGANSGIYVNTNGTGGGNYFGGYFQVSGTSGGQSGIYALNTSSSTGSKYGVQAYTGGSSGTNYGTFTSAADAAINYGLFSDVYSPGTVNYAIYGNAEVGSTNWAGYFNNGNVYIKDNLGIGTITPGAALDVAGDIQTSSDFVYATPVTKYKSISPTSFSPTRDGYNNLVMPTVNERYMFFKVPDSPNAGFGAYAEYTLDLPDGAVITELRAYLYAESAGEAQIALFEVPFASLSAPTTTPKNTVGNVQGSGSGYEEVFTAASTTVDNANNYYVLRFTGLTTELVPASNRLYGVRVEYQITKVD